MEWIIDKIKPICPQICEQICLQIATGRLKPNDKIFSVREAAIAAGVNPNTVQRAFETLEQQEILYSVRGSGWYVSQDTSNAQNTLKQLQRDKTLAYFSDMRKLGMTDSEIKTYIKEWDYE